MLTRRTRFGFAALLVSGLAVATGATVTAGHAETLELLLEYPAASLGVTDRDGYTDLRLPGAELLSRPGAPALPVRAEQVVLPAGKSARGVEAVSLASVRLSPGTIRPFQPPAVLVPAGMERPAPEPVPADPAIYTGAALYPADLAVFRGTGHLGDLTIAACEVHPVQYDPATREIILHTRIALRLELEPDPVAPAPARPREMTRIAAELADRGLHGAEDLSPAWTPGHALRLNPNDYQYVIVTGASQQSVYETYAAWKTAKGVPATVVTVEWIDANYPGRDRAERIRNFVIDAVNTWGTSYVLLGGDQEIVPSRPCWAFDCEFGGYDDENDLYADLYFSDLDGSWDANGNGVFGEVDDDVDLYPDVLVGRAPTDDATDAEGVINKFLTYERTPPADYAMEAFFFAEVLWNDPFTDSGIGKDMIADAHFGEAYEPIERQYETLGNETALSVRQYLNWGPHLTNHGGHANWQVMGCAYGYLLRENVDEFVNGPRYFVLYSIGCWSAAFDRDDCIAEHFAINPNGGTIAFVGNVRYGWGSPGNPGWGYSETFDRDFYGAILTEGLTQFGAAVVWPKILRIPFSQDENVYRWHEYQVNLLGDPEMTCHTAEITAMTVEAPPAIPIGPTQFTATVTDAAGPVAGARLCLAGPDVYQVGFTDAMGQLVFTPDLPEAQMLTLTATAASHPFEEIMIAAAGNDPFLTVVSKAIDDDAVAPSAGNGDGEIGPGEVIELFVTVHNYGGSACTGLTGTLATTNPHVVVENGEAAYGTVGAGGEAANATPFVFGVAHACPPDEVITFALTLEDDGADSWTEAVALVVVVPGIGFDHYTLAEVAGDGDGIADPGETVALTVTVINRGGGDSSPVTATLTTTDPNLAVTQSVASSAVGLAPGETAILNPPFEVQIDAGCPPITYGSLGISFAHDEGTDLDAFLLAVGEPGFADDMEGGAGAWTHSGTNDLWHRTTYRSHSGNYSWYCGTGAHAYVNDMNASLTSPEFVVPEDGELSFWGYFDVTTYGVDGLFVEVWNDTDWETLDFLGSGGALDSTLFVVGWSKYAYDLGDHVPGSTTQVRFRFVSDEVDTAEGFYVDDVRIRTSGPTTGVDQPLGPETGRGWFSVSPLSRNPASRSASWRLALPEAAPVVAAIYDVRGRLVRTLVRADLDPGEHDLRWNGNTRGETPVPDGVYFLHVRAGERTATRKVVMLRR